MNVLFVCTGNIFRSASAEYLLKAYMNKNKINNIHVESAGTQALIQKPHPASVKALAVYGLSLKNHKQRKLTATIVDSANILVAMDETHQNYLMENFNKKSYLFNEICYGEQTPLLDACDTVNLSDDEATNEYIIKVIDYIHDSIPLFVKNVDKFNEK